MSKTIGHKVQINFVDETKAPAIGYLRTLSPGFVQVYNEAGEIEIYGGVHKVTVVGGYKGQDAAVAANPDEAADDDGGESEALEIEAQQE